MQGAIYPSLKDRTVLVTGGGCGIGEAIGRQFCERASPVDIEKLGRNVGETVDLTRQGRCKERDAEGDGVQHSQSCLPRTSKRAHCPNVLR